MSEPSAEHVNATIRAELARRGFTQGDLAAAIGLHQVTVSQRMVGRRQWALDELQRVADYLGISLVDLVDDERKVS